MDDDQRNHLEGLRQTHLRRLRILEQQAAVSGTNTRPEVLTEIEDLQASIAQIDAQLASVVATPRTRVATPARPTPPEQRRTQATILSATLVGASALFATLDPEDAVEIMGELWQRLDTIVTEHGGMVDRRAEDTLLAIWGVQAAREDDPERAIRAALALKAALAEFRATHSLALSLRIGISTSLVLIGALGAAGASTSVGSAATLAGQLQQVAPDHGILIAYDTYRHVRGLFAVVPRGQLALGGTGEPPEAYLVTAAKPRSLFLGSRGVEGIETRLIGRDAELARLQEAFQTVAEDRELQAITIVGEAGVGKSRLLHAFRSWEELQVEQAWLFAGRALPELISQPYALLRDVFASRFEIQDNDAPATLRDKLERGIASGFGASDLDAVPKAHMIGQLLGFDFAASPHVHILRDDAKQLHDQALHYLSQYVGALTRTRPLLVLEDLHWADDASLDALAALLRSCRTMPVLAVCLARPALFERRPAWGEGAEGQTRLRLEPLSKRASRQLVEEILRRAPEVPVAVREQIVTAAEGNPFYVEELIKMLIDESVIVPGEDGWQVEPARLDTLHVPPTLTGVLQARLDSLQPDERGSLERASVVGRIFWDRAVAQLGDGDAPERIQAQLDGLRRRELVFRHEVSAFAGASEYLFKHMLLREVTYERVLKRQRRAYHAQAAAWLIAESGERADEYAALIAEHYERAGDVAQAAEWHVRAARVAQAAYANADAIAHYEHALAVLPEDRRGGILLGLGQVLELIGQWDAAKERYLAALALAEQIHDGVMQGECQQALGNLLVKRGDYVAAHEWLAAARDGAVARGDRAGEAAALWRLGTVARRQGDFAGGQALFTASLALAREIGDKYRIAMVLIDLSYMELIQDNLGQAQTLVEESLALFREIGHKQGVAATLVTLAWGLRNQNNYLEVPALLEESLSLAREIGDKYRIASALSNLGAVAYEQGNYVEARMLSEESLILWRELGDKQSIAGEIGSQGVLAQLQGNFGQARTLLEESLALFRELEDKHNIVNSLFQLGILAQQQENYAEAQAFYTESLELAHQLQDANDIKYILAMVAALAAATGQLDRALRLAGAADVVLRAQRATLLSPARELYETGMRVVQAQLDAATFAAVWAEGQAMTMEQAIDYALGEDA